MDEKKPKKVLFAWPPLKNPKGYATCGQNRQMQWFKDPTFIYPIVPALAATMLNKAGHQVLWVDSIASEFNETDFGRAIIEWQPDYIVFECSTPLIHRYQEIIAGIKETQPHINIILTGDHVTALKNEPEIEKIDAKIITGGKWHRSVYQHIHGEAWRENIPLPHIDRNLTQWWLYAYKNGNYKFIPGTYIMSAMDCWHRPGCTFCSWANYHQHYECRPVEDVLQEIEELITMGFKEIFDDSGTFPIGEWLETFCREMIDRGYNKYVSIGCNMRFGALTHDQFALMKKAGFRMILWGLESVNQDTLNRLKKNTTTIQIKEDIIAARNAGLDSHLTVMFGYPWETYEEALRTYKMVRYWLIKGFVNSAQATICIPYPITDLWKECKKEGTLLTEEWDEYDMTQPVMKVPYSDKQLFALQKGIYNVALHPEFIIRKLLSVRSMDDLRYMFRIAHKVYDRLGSFYEVSKAAQEF